MMNTKRAVRTSGGRQEPKDDFIQVPRSLVYAGRFLPNDHGVVNPRHRMLLLVLWAREYPGKPNRAYWEDLGRDVGVTASTVRKWGYELEKAGLLRIIRHKGPVRSKENGRPGRRDERNTFDLGPVHETIRNTLDPKRRKERGRARGSATDQGVSP